MDYRSDRGILTKGEKDLAGRLCGDPMGEPSIQTKKHGRGLVDHKLHGDLICRSVVGSVTSIRLVSYLRRAG